LHGLLARIRCPLPCQTEARFQRQPRFRNRPRQTKACLQMQPWFPNQRLSCWLLGSSKVCLPKFRPFQCQAQPCLRKQACFRNWLRPRHGHNLGKRLPCPPKISPVPHQTQARCWQTESWKGQLLAAPTTCNQNLLWRKKVLWRAKKTSPCTQTWGKAWRR
jgi:hypothetical protein